MFISRKEVLEKLMESDKRIGFRCREFTYCNEGGLEYGGTDANMLV